MFKMMTKRPTTRMSALLLAFGAISIAVSIDYSDEILALIGLTLVLWGTIIMNSSPEKYIHSKILTSSFEKINSLYGAIIRNRKLIGTPIYYSPDNLWGLSNVLIYIGKKDETQLVEIAESDGFELSDEYAVLMPPGLALSDLIEEELNMNAASMKLENLKNNINKAVVDQLELAEEIDIQLNQEDFLITISKSLLHNDLDNYYLDNEKEKIIGDPLISAIICILAKILHKPIFIENIKYNSTNFKLEANVKTK
jgi:hypothetical protein